MRLLVMDSSRSGQSTKYKMGDLGLYHWREEEEEEEEAIRACHLNAPMLCVLQRTQPSPSLSRAAFN